MKTAATPGGSRRYLIALNKWRSRAALAACLLTLFAALGAIAWGLVSMAENGEQAGDLFRYFTTDSNLLTALAASCIIPFALEGVRKKRFTYPRWAALIHYAGTICTTVTMVFAVCVIGFYDADMAFGGSNLALHLLCPMLILAAFFLVESDRRFTLRDSLLCMTPYVAYTLVYLVQAVLVGEEKGGWPDLYHLTEFVPVFLSLPAMLLLGFGISTAIRLLANRMTAARQKRLTALWRSDADPVEIRIEVFGLGRYEGKAGEESDLSLPMDILELLAARYGMRTEELVRPYTRGLLDALAEKRAGRSGPGGGQGGQQAE